MKKNPNLTLLFTDIDSLAYKVVGHDLYAGMEEIKDQFDFSEYPENHFLKSFNNMKVVGKFKDECKGQLMLNFIGLRPKLYSFDNEREAYFEKNEDGEDVEVEKSTDTSITRIVIANKNTAKGVKDVVAKKFSFDDYKRCLQTLSPKPVNIKTIGSDHHEVFTYNMENIGLSAFDTKRWICDDGIHTYAYGHSRTR